MRAPLLMSIPLTSNAPQASYLPPLTSYPHTPPPIPSCPAPQHVMSHGHIRHSHTHPIMTRTPARHVPHPSTSCPAALFAIPTPIPSCPSAIFAIPTPIPSCPAPQHVISRTPARHIPHPSHHVPRPYSSFPRRRESPVLRPTTYSLRIPGAAVTQTKPSLPQLLDRAKRVVLQSRHHAA